jgi:hypothetical protein
MHDHTEVILLTFMTRLMVIKFNYFFFNNCYNNLGKLISDILLKPHKVGKDMHQFKKIFSSLGMKYEKIDMCLDNHILFWERACQKE